MNYWENPEWWAAAREVSARYAEFCGIVSGRHESTDPDYHVTRIQPARRAWVETVYAREEIKRRITHV